MTGGCSCAVASTGYAGGSEIAAANGEVRYLVDIARCDGCVFGPRKRWCGVFVRYLVRCLRVPFLGDACVLLASV
jgi:hypothetical protein